MWLSGNPVMQIIDTNTLYQTGEFIKSKSIDELWDTFIRCWATIFIGYPSKIRLDQETAFDSTEFRRTEREARVALQFSGVESHNSIGVWERYHSTLRRIYNKVQEDHPLVLEETALRMAIKGCNDTAGPRGLVPTMLVFGAMPALPTTNFRNPRQKERMMALQTAREEMAKIAAEQRVIMALKSKVPPDSRFVLKPGDLVRVYREKERRWIGPVEIVKLEDKSVFVSDTTKVVKFKISKIMPIRINHPAEDEGLDKIFTYSDKVDEERHSNVDVFLTEVIDSKNPRTKRAKAKKAVRKELEGLYTQGVFEKVHRRDIPMNAVMLHSKFVYAIKNVGTNEEDYKARFATGRHRDRMKE